METNKLNISISAIKKLTPPDQGADFYWDKSLKGFGIRIQPGGTVAFIAQGRINGKAKRITVGKLTRKTPEIARREARQMLADMDKGIDPKAKQKARDSLSLTLEDALDEYLAGNSRLKESTRDDYRTRIKRYLGDWLDRPVVEISRDDVKEKHHEIGERSEAQANLAMRYLRAVLNHVMDNHFDEAGNPIILHNPVKALKRQWYAVAPKSNYLRDHQIPIFLEAVDGLGNDLARDYLRFLLLTGLRRSEALSLAWEHVDLKGGSLTLPDPKNRRAHILPITDQMREILKRRGSLCVGEHVFESPAGLFGNVDGAIKQVRERTGFYIAAHDLRRTFATVANEIGLGAYTIKALMNHRDANDVTAQYIQRTATKLRDPMQRINDQITGGNHDKA